MNLQKILPKSIPRKNLYYASAAVAFAAVVPLFVRSEYVVGHVITIMLVFAIYASSWNLLATSGQGSLGHAAFLGIGGFASALTASRLGLNPLVGLLFGSLISAFVGFLIGLVCVRLKAWFLAMVTFGFSVIAITVISQFDDFFAGMIGFRTSPIVAQSVYFYYATLVIAAVSVGSIYLVMKSKWGLAFQAIRENEQEAKMIGINTSKYRLLAFVISTLFAGLAGGLYAQSIQFIQISIFEPYFSFLPLIMSVIGGLGTIEGPIIGSVIIVSIDSFLPLTDKYLQPLAFLFPGVSNVGPQLRLIALGVFLILVVIFLPKGITSLLHKAYDHLSPQLQKLYDSLGEDKEKGKKNEGH